jgi:demethylsterigmatocystin 6-O-methyltransferase
LGIGKDSFLGILEGFGRETLTQSFKHLQSVAVRIGIDLKIFRILSADPEKKFSLDELAKETGAEKVLLGRLLRYQAALGLIKETARDEFAATNITKTLSTEGNEGCIKH